MAPGLAGPAAPTWDGLLCLQPYGAVQRHCAVGGGQGQQPHAQGVGPPVEFLRDACGLGEREELRSLEPKIMKGPG